MTLENYQQALTDAQLELHQAVRQRDELNWKIIQLQNTIRALALAYAQEERQQIMEDAERFSLSLSEAVKAVLRHNKRPMTAAEVRDALWAAGFDMGQYANALPLVQSTLERLRNSRPAFVVRLRGRPAAYFWPFLE